MKSHDELKADIGIRLYGTREEWEAVFEKNYLDQNILKLNFSSIGWLNAATLTKKIQHKKFSPNQLLKKPFLRDIRVIGAGIQNAVSTAELVLFLRNSLSNEGIRLITFFIMPEKKSNYIEGMRCSLKGESFNFGSSQKIHFNLPGKIIDRGVLMNKNISSAYCNVVNGCRVDDNFFVSDKGQRKFLFFGASEVFGTGLLDTQTIPAQYQLLLGSTSSSICLNLGMGGRQLYRCSSPDTED